MHLPGYAMLSATLLFLALYPTASADAPKVLKLPADVRVRCGPIHRDGKPCEVYTILFCAGGKLLAAANGDDSVRFWDTATGKEVRRIQLPQASVRVLAGSPDGRTIVTWGENYTLCLWDVATGRKLREWNAHTKTLHCLAFSPDGQTVASGSEDQTLRLWDPATGKEKRCIPLTAQLYNCLMFSPDSKLVASVGDDHRVHLWEVSTGLSLPLEQQGNSVNSVIFSPDGRTLAAAGTDYAVRLWEVATGKQRTQLVGNGGSLLDVHFLDQGRLLGSAQGGAIRLWDVTTAKELRQIRGHEDMVFCLASAADGKTLASSSTDGSVILWDLPRLLPPRPPALDLSAEQLQRLWNDLGEDGAVAFSAVWRLTVAKQTVSFLKQQVRPSASVEPQRLQRLLRDLDDNRFVVRSQATRELEQLGELAEDALRETLTNTPPLETRRRIEQILAKLTLSQPSLRALRALEVLEQIGNREALEALVEAAKGTPQTRLTRAAQDSVTRLRQRRIKVP